MGLAIPGLINPALHGVKSIAVRIAFQLVAHVNFAVLLEERASTIASSNRTSQSLGEGVSIVELALGSGEVLCGDFEFKLRLGFLRRHEEQTNHNATNNNRLRVCTMSARTKLSWVKWNFETPMRTARTLR